jgi:hypothetical protein
MFSRPTTVNLEPADHSQIRLQAGAGLDLGRVPVDGGDDDDDRAEHDGGQHPEHEGEQRSHRDQQAVGPAGWPNKNILIQI